LVAGLPAWLGVAATARAQPAAPTPPEPQPAEPQPAGPQSPGPQSSDTDEPVTRVTSDSPEFCAQLAHQLRDEERARRPATVSDEVRMLGQEGRKMCHEGHVRPGILRIRRALLLLKGD
jgi:hypothetical protein